MSGNEDFCNEKFDVQIFANKSDTVDIVERKSMAIGSFLPLQNNIVHLTQLRGNFWRICGFSKNSKDYLYPEEALYLVERSFLIVRLNEVTVDYSLFYKQIVDFVSLSFYLTYIKLKTLDYITFRHTCNARSFSGDRDLYEYLERNPTFTLLETLVAFDVYPQTGTFSKRVMREGQPTSYVVVMSGEETFSARVMLALLAEAKGVPVIVAAMTNTGHVLLEEFTDAAETLDWTNSVALPMRLLDDELVVDDDEVEEGEDEMLVNNEEEEGEEEAVVLSEILLVASQEEQEQQVEVTAPHFSVNQTETEGLETAMSVIENKEEEKMVVVLERQEVEVAEQFVINQVEVETSEIVICVAEEKEEEEKEVLSAHEEVSEMMPVVTESAAVFPAHPVDCHREIIYISDSE